MIILLRTTIQTKALTYEGDLDFQMCLSIRNLYNVRVKQELKKRFTSDTPEESRTIYFIDKDKIVVCLRSQRADIER